MSTWKILAVVFVLAGLALAIAVRVGGRSVPNSFDESVREAVENVTGFARVNEEARAHLRIWGDAALPALEAMAAEPGGLENVKLVIAVTKIKTQAAADLLLKMVEREATSELSHALLFMRGLAASKSDRHLLESDRFKRAIMARAADPHDSFDLKLVAEIVEDMGWSDELPRVRGMLTHPNLEVRRAAAACVGSLTGENVSIQAPQVAFPAARIDSGLVELIGPAVRPYPMGAVTFVSRSGEAQEKQLLFVSQHKTCFFDANLRPLDELPIKVDAEQCLVLPTDAGAQQLVTHVQRGVSAGGSEVLAYEFDGKLRWRFQVDGQDIEVMTPLYGHGEVQGLVLGLGGERGVLALDLEGEILWSLPKRFVVYDLLTHPSLPGCVGICSGYVEVIQEPDGGILSDLTERVSRTPPLWSGGEYVTSGLLFPDREGRLAGLTAGSDANAVPVLLRRDDQGGKPWTATLPQQVIGLACIDAAAGPRLFAAVTDAAELLVFDEDGTLLHHRLLDSAKSSRLLMGRSAKDVQAGLLGDSWAVAVTTIEGTYVYRILPPESRR